jgi:CheY-like chemotaxis protein
VSASAVANGADPAASTTAAPASPPQLRILVVEDNPFDLAVLEDLVQGAPPAALQLFVAATRNEGERVAATTELDVILLDLNLPDSTGISTLLEWQHSAATTAPVIVLSGNDHPDVIREARSLGAVHFIQKDHLSELADSGAAGSVKLTRLLRTTVRQANSHARGT